MQDWTATMRHEVTRKRSTKRLKHTRNLFRKNIQLKDVSHLHLRSEESILLGRQFHGLAVQGKKLLT